MLLEILCLVILFIPLLWELWDDRNGDYHNSGNDDWILRGLLMVVSSVFVFLIHPNKNIVQIFLLTFSIFTSLFPYLINVIHYKRGVIHNHKWWDHLSKSAIPDKWPMWAKTPWYGRMFAYGVLLFAAIKLYVCWEGLYYWDACK